MSYFIYLKSNWKRFLLAAVVGSTVAVGKLGSMFKKRE